MRLRKLTMCKLAAFCYNMVPVLQHYQHFKKYLINCKTHWDPAKRYINRYCPHFMVNTWKQQQPSSPLPFNPEQLVSSRRELISISDSVHCTVNRIIIIIIINEAAPVLCPSPFSETHRSRCFLGSGDNDRNRR